MQDSFYNHVKSGEKNLNDLEGKILRYIVSLRGDIEQATSKGIAAHFYVAPNTIVRLAHKLGFTGFTELKHSYLLSLERNRYTIETIPLDLQIIQTKDLVHDITINKVVDAIEHAGHIVFFCSGFSKYPCLEMAEKLKIMGKNTDTLSERHVMRHYAELLGRVKALVRRYRIYMGKNTPEGKTVNTHLMRTFLHSYARNVGSQCPVSEIIKDCIGSMNTKLGENTAYSYLKRLKDLFVVDEAGSWNPNLRSKTAIRTSPTRYFCDPSIAVASLGASPDDLIDDMRTFGFIFENLCMRDLRVYSRFLDGEVLHYRDGNNLECDAVIHLPNGKYALIEIKIGGEQAIEHGAATLKKLASLIDVGKMRAPSFLMVLTGLTKYPYRRDDGVFVVPVDCLKP